MLVTAPSDDSGLSKLRRIAHHQYRQLILVQVFGGGARHVRRRYFLHAGAEPLQVVRG